MGVFEVAAGGLVLIGSVGTYWWWRRRRGTRGGDPFSGMRDRAFEALVADAFRAQGYEPVKATDIKAAAPVGEFLMRRERTTYLVECKHWKSSKVGVDLIQALQRTMAARGASAGFVLSRGRLSREATALANGCSIRLIDGPALQAMVERVKKH